ncbi:MAG: 16S rRNA (cytosine(1402)-N(4))-methyltransferase RsmH [Candidatus Eisenbacteria bacterium]
MHLPVMAAEVVKHLVTRTDGVYVDCTVGGGGHARPILLNAPAGRLLGVDMDEAALSEARNTLESFGGRYELAHGNFAQLREIAAESGFREVDGVLFDLGFSSLQLDDPERGLSFSGDGPIDMRLDRSTGETALHLIAHSSERELAGVLFEFGEEKRSHPIARSIIEARDRGRLETTSDLTGAVLATKPARRTKTLARVFQALRIAVNSELSNLRAGLKGAVEILRPGGRIVVISYHSLEDRITKHFFLDCENPCTCPRELPECACGAVPTLRVLTRRIVRPGQSELAENSRARSAKLRVAERLGQGERP